MELIKCDMARKPPSKADLAAAARLRALWEPKEKAGITQEQFAPKCGMGQAAFSHYLTGRIAIGIPATLKFAAAFNVSPLEIRPDKKKLLQFALKNDGQNVSKPYPDTRRIPVISYVQAGEFVEAVDSYAAGSGMDDIFTDLDLGPYAFALVIHGDSMEPEFKEGDKIIIDPAISPNPGDYVVAKNGSNEVTFKKYRPRGINEHGKEIFELAPLNEDYATIRSDLTPCRIIGTMIEHRRLRKGQVIDRQKARDGERAYRERHASARKRDTK